MKLDEQIHRTAWEGSQNPYLIETLERYYALSLRVWYVVLDRVPGLGAAVFDHAKLLEAILDRDPAQAKALMREHVIGFEREIMAAFSATRPRRGSAEVASLDGARMRFLVLAILGALLAAAVSASPATALSKHLCGISGTVIGPQELCPGISPRHSWKRRATSP